jgi:hypothetical protein
MALGPADPHLRQEYAAVKVRATASAANIDDYGRAKDAMVQRILAAGGLTDAERASINANQVPSRDEFPRERPTPADRHLLLAAYGSR